MPNHHFNRKKNLKQGLERHSFNQLISKNLEQPQYLTEILISLLLVSETGKDSSITTISQSTGALANKTGQKEKRKERGRRGRKGAKM